MLLSQSNKKPIRCAPGVLLCCNCYLTSFYVSVIYHVYFQIWLSWTCICAKCMLIWNRAFRNVIKLLCLWHHWITINYSYNPDWVDLLLLQESKVVILRTCVSSLQKPYLYPSYMLAGLLLHKVGYYFILMVPHRQGITAVIIKTRTTNYNVVYLHKVGAYTVSVISIWWQSQYVPAKQISFTKTMNW